MGAAGAADPLEAAAPGALARLNGFPGKWVSNRMGAGFTRPAPDETTDRSERATRTDQDDGEDDGEGEEQDIQDVAGRVPPPSPRVLS